MLGRGVVGLALVLSSKYGQVKLQLTWCVSVQVHLFVQRGKKGTSREAEPVFWWSGEMYKWRIV